MRRRARRRSAPAAWATSCPAPTPATAVCWCARDALRLGVRGLRGGGGAARSLPSAHDAGGEGGPDVPVLRRGARVGELLAGLAGERAVAVHGGSMTAVWLEEWRPEGARIFLRITLDGGFGLAPVGYFRFDDKSFYGDMERTRLAAAAPSLVRALLAAEVCLHGCSEGCGYQPACGTCDGNVDFIAEGPVVVGHKVDHGKIAGGLACPLDAALTLAGLPDQASRDAARAAIAARVAR